MYSPNRSADLLLRAPAGDREAEGRQELERARALMRETGAKLLENFTYSAKSSDRFKL